MTWNSFWNWLDIQLGFAQPPVVETPPPVTIPSTTVQVAPTTMTPFQIFCASIIKYEGANPENNNPFDFRYYFGGYLPKYGTVKESPKGFAMFETLELGTEYGTICITEMIQNHPEWDFFDFFARFAPSNDNNDPVLYAKTVASWCSVEPTANLKVTLKL